MLKFKIGSRSHFLHEKPRVPALSACRGWCWKLTVTNVEPFSESNRCGPSRKQGQAGGVVGGGTGTEVWLSQALVFHQIAAAQAPFDCRGGLVAPWTAVPALVALATDPQRDVADASLRLLRRQVPPVPSGLHNSCACLLPLSLWVRVPECVQRTEAHRHECKEEALGVHHRPAI